MPLKDAFPSISTCPDGWALFEGSKRDLCHLGVSSQKSWTAARDDCVARGGHLATIDGKDVNDELHKIQLGDHKWIGLNDRAIEGRYVWVEDDSVTTYTAWYPTEPSGSGEGCIEQYTSEGEWNDKPCSTPRPYICQISLEDKMLCNSPYTLLGDNKCVLPTMSCPAGWTGVSTYAGRLCHKVERPAEGKSWHEAQASCRTYGGYLATISSQEVQDSIEELMTATDRVWIGANHQPRQ